MMAGARRPAPEVSESPDSPYVEEIVLTHPDVENSRFTTTRAAYDEVWAERGWTVASGEAEELPPPDQDQS